MVNWDYYGISVYDMNAVRNALREMGYIGRPPDRRSQNEEIDLKRYKKGKLFHLQISLKKSRTHFQLHQDLKKNGYHKGVNGGNELYEEKYMIIERLKACLGG